MEKSRDRTGLIMRLTDVKVTTLADLYAEGDGEIDIGELLDDPNVTDTEADQLSKLDKEGLRKSLYRAVGELMELAGVDSALELKQMFPDESLLAAIMQLHAGNPEVVAAKLNAKEVDTSLSEADRSLSEKISQIGQIEGVEVKVKNDRLWLNGYPFAYEEFDGIVKLRQADDPTKEIPFPLDASDPINFAEGVKEFYNNFWTIDSKASEALKASGLDSSAKIEWSDTMDQWIVKGAQVPANNSIGIAGGDLIEIFGKFTTNGTLELKAYKEGNVITAENLNDELLKGAIDKNIREKGPKCCKNGKLHVEYKSGNTVNVIAKGSKATLKYTGGKYILIEADFENGRMLDFYGYAMELDAGQILKTELKGLEGSDGELLSGYDLINWDNEINERSELLIAQKFKSKELRSMLEASIRGLSSNDTDMESRIDGIKKKILDDFRARLQEISGDFEVFKQTGNQISSNDFQVMYVDKLHLAGTPSKVYRRKTQELLSIIRGSNFPLVDKYGPQYYTVKTLALSALYSETGHLAIKEPLTPADLKVVDDVLVRIEKSLKASLTEGQILTNTVLTSEFERHFRDMDATVVVPEVTPPAPAKLDTKLHLERFENKEKALEEYKRYISAQFDSVKDIVDGTDVDYFAPQWDALLELKKEHFLASINKADFDRDYASAAASSNPQNSFRAMIDADMHNSGLLDRIDGIKKASVNLDDDKYFDVATELMFIDSKSVFEGIQADPTIKGRVDALTNQFETTGDPAVLQQITDLSRKPGFEGRQEAYKNYVEGVLLTTMSTTTKDPAKLRLEYREAFTNIESYTDVNWEHSDSILISRISQMDNELNRTGIHPSQIEASYDVQAFMNNRYDQMIASAVAQGNPSGYINSKIVEGYMETEQLFLSQKKNFWNQADLLKLKGDELQKAGTYEQSVHEVIATLDQPESVKVELYRSTLEFILGKLRAEDNFDGEDLSDHIYDTAKDKLSIKLDKGAINVVD